METGLYFPGLIIQRILSFLDHKEAARFCVLSKSWYAAWSSLPFLFFDEYDFIRNGGDLDAFRDFTRKTLKRYKELDLQVESFDLRMEGRYIDVSTSIANELIVNALDLGLRYLGFYTYPPNSNYVLPAQVFASTSLTRLDIYRCKIGPLIDGRAICSNLVSLVLNLVSIGDDVIEGILRGCPLIEQLYLADCEDFRKINVSGLDKLKSFIVKSVPTCTSIEFERRLNGPFTDNRIKGPEFPNLICLVLDDPTIDDAFFSEFSSWFPSIEDVTLENFGDSDTIQISSNSLKFFRMSITHILKKAQFDVPNIRLFKFSGDCISSLSLTTASKDWESNIEFYWYDGIDVSWCLELKNFLMQLKLSKISLKINLIVHECVAPWENIHNFPIPILEKLTLWNPPLSSTCSDFLGALFWSCRPKIITQAFDDLDGRDFTFLQLLYETCMQHVNQINISTNQNLHCMDDLKEINVEFGEDDPGNWLPIDGKKFIDGSIIPKKEEQVRLHLKWDLSTPDLTMVN